MRVTDHLLAAVGEWSGTNALRMMPDDDFRRSSGTATTATHSGGNVATISYTWSDFDGHPQEGLLVLSDGEGDGTVAVVWSDSWHQHPQWMPMSGTVDADGRISVRGVYGEGAEQGGWWIHIDPTNAAQLTITMDNDMTETGQYEVVRAIYTRP
jgi:hypothetical protein